MKNATLENMKSMKLLGMASSYEGVISLPLNQQADKHEMIAAMIDAEQQHRSKKKMDMYIRLSKLRYRATIQDIYCSEKRNLSKSQLMSLTDGSYIDRSENVLITGSTGCGKSYLGCALVHQACVLGYRALYFNLNRLTEQIALAKADGTIIKWLNRIKRAKLIILDDFGLQPMTHQVKLILLQILEDRYENGSTIISSQLPVANWHDYLNEPTIADAILDRLVPKSHRIELKGKSLRKRLETVS
jgi:DNA replication protein DnaC